MSDKNNDAINKFLGEFGEDNKNGFETEAENPFETTEQVTPTEEPVEEPKTRRNLSYSEDPKVQKYVKKEISKALEEYQKTLPKQEVAQNEDIPSVVAAFTSIIGNDTPEKVAALSSLEKALNNVDNRASQIAVKKIEEIQSQQTLEDEQAEEEVSDALDEIETKFDVDITSSNKSAIAKRVDFLKYVEKIAPKDKDGNITAYPDMVSAYETFEELQKSKQTPSRSKELASRSMARSSETTVSPQRRPTWDAADEFIASLKN